MRKLRTQVAPSAAQRRSDSCRRAGRLQSAQRKLRWAGLRRAFSPVLAFCGLVAALAVAAPARAELAQSGDWSEPAPKVTLSKSQLSRSAALAELAKLSGWNIVYQGPDSALFELHVTDVPADTLLGALFADGNYRANRTGNLIVISAGAAPPEAVAEAASGSPSSAATGPASAAAAAPPAAAPTAAPTSAAPPAAASAGPPASARSAHTAPQDSIVTGGSLTLAADEVVRDLMVIGGDVELHGRVTGNLTLLGGEATLYPEGHILGDVHVSGGHLKLEGGSKIDGDVSILGGELERDAEAVVAGRVDETKQPGAAAQASQGESMDLIQDAGSALTRSALLFVFGVVLIALATGRMSVLTQEVTLRPMRSFALGIIGWLGALVAVIALSVTVIGIPLALLGVLLVVFFSYAGICAVLTTVGGVLIRHRTNNPYTHLAVGCALFLLLGALPWVGSLFTFAIVTTGFGAVIAGRKLALSARQATPA